MLILSIDVGIRNLGLCLIDSNTKHIKHWDATGVPPEHTDGLYKSLYTHFKERPWVLECSKVLIEKQPDKNKTMKSVEHFIHTYFICNEKDVQVYDARFKIPDVIGPGKAMYAKRKKASVVRCTEFLKETYQNELLNWFLKQKKKDDLADTVMQALSYIDKTIVVNDTSSSHKKTPKPRKPTPNQTETKYSKANLAWLYLNGGSDLKRFDKDLKRYYKNLQEMLSEFKLNERK